MKKFFPILITLVIGLVVVAPVFASNGSNTYIVVFREDADPDIEARRLQREYNVEVAGIYEHAIKGAVVSAKKSVINQLARDERVVLVEENQIFHVDEQIVPTGIQRIFPDDNVVSPIYGIDDVTVNADVAVLDTGIDLYHPDLNLYTAINCTWNGPNEGTCDSVKNDGNGHGTHVAGIIGALDNDIGVVGVAPGVRLWAVKVLTNYGTGTTAQIIGGIEWVAAHADYIEVANMSLGGRGESTAMDMAISNAVAEGVVFVLSAGNAAIDVNNYHPAGNPDAITVSALADFDGEPGGEGEPTCRDDIDDTLAYFSNYGEGVDIAAPGVCIFSTYSDGRYATMSGTSMSAPHVAGAAAIISSSGVNTPTQVKSILLSKGNYDWVDDAPDGIQEPLLDLSDEVAFTPGTLPVSGGIWIIGIPDSVAGTHQTKLTWGGATSQAFDIHRDGDILDDPLPDYECEVIEDDYVCEYNDVIDDSGLGYHGYIVCESGTDQCSQPIFLEY